MCFVLLSLSPACRNAAALAPLPSWQLVVDCIYFLSLFFLGVVPEQVGGWPCDPQLGRGIPGRDASFLSRPCPLMPLCLGWKGRGEATNRRIAATGSLSYAILRLPDELGACPVTSAACMCCLCEFCCGSRVMQACVVGCGTSRPPRGAPGNAPAAAATVAAAALLLSCCCWGS
jgi:hypothetical protein